MGAVFQVALPISQCGVRNSMTPALFRPSARFAGRLHELVLFIGTCIQVRRRIEFAELGGCAA
jgi:hypothetical protein